jgi:hypothetical protein
MRAKLANTISEKTPSVSLMTEEDVSSKDREIMVSKIAQLVQTCPRFFDWDLCESECDLYEFCDAVFTAMDLGRMFRLDESFFDKVRAAIELVKKRLEGEKD